MKVLYVITGLGQGGAERVVCDLADKMYEKGCKVKIAYLIGDVLTQPTQKNIELIKLNLSSLISLPKTYFSLVKLIKDYQPDVVHSHMVHANLLVRLVRLATPINKLICTAHSANEGGSLRMGLYRITHSLSDLTTNVSEYASKSFIQKNAVPGNDITTMYNGVNFNIFQYDSAAKDKIKKELSIGVNTKIILAVGRFHSAKNYPNLIQAIASLKNKANDFVVLIAGDGELRSEIEACIRKEDVSSEVMLLGRRSDIPVLMSACDVFVLSSDYEGLPTVLIEAMACQAHVVSTDVSGAREIIHGNGEIVPTGDPESLAKSIESLLIEHNKNKLGAEYVKTKFDLNVISDQWLGMYCEK